jgi:hypothetical protein
MDETPIDDPSPDPSPPTHDDAPAKAARGRGGAPVGNVNAARDPKFTRAMRDAQAVAKRNRARRRRSRHDDAKAILAECGLSDSPLAQRLGVRLAQLDHEIDECERITNRVGRVRRDHSLSPVFERYLSLTQADRVELVKLIDRLAELRTGIDRIDSLDSARTRICEIAAAWPGSLEFRAAFDDGSPLTALDAPERPALPGPDVALPEPRADRGIYRR